MYKSSYVFQCFSLIFNKNKTKLINKIESFGNLKKISSGKKKQDW